MLTEVKALRVTDLCVSRSEPSLWPFSRQNPAWRNISFASGWRCPPCMTWIFALWVFLKNILCKLLVFGALSLILTFLLWNFADPWLELLHREVGKRHPENHHYSCSSSAGKKIRLFPFHLCFKLMSRSKFELCLFIIRWRIQYPEWGILTGFTRNCWRRMTSTSRRKSVSCSPARARDRFVHLTETWFVKIPTLKFPLHPSVENDSFLNALFSSRWPISL